MSRRIRVLIADDHAVLRSGLRLLINTQRDLTVVGEAGDAQETLARLRHLDVDVVLLDLCMPGNEGVALVKQVVALRPRIRVLVLTMYDDAAYARAAVAAGAAGYMVKKAADVELLSAIRAVNRGRTFVDVTRAPEGAGGRPRSSAGPAALLSPLSAREDEVLRLLGRGHTNREIGERLGLSVKTVETYRLRLSDKLGLRGRADFVRYALDAGFLLPRG